MDRLHTGSTFRPKRVRDAQRLVHLATAAVLVGYVYLTPPAGSPYAVLVQWIALPVLALSGVALWQWARLRRLWRLWRRPR
jgi:hypothetical protein